MGYMFRDCKQLTSLDVSNFDTSKVTRMEHMFRNCESLPSLNLSSFDVGSVTYMNCMFDDCSYLVSLQSMKNIKVSLSFQYAAVDITSILDVINNLAPVTSATLSLRSVILNALTDEQKLIAINKGWTLA